MPTIKETIHHASGTYEKGAEVGTDHPLFVAAPHLFDTVGAAEVAPELPVKRGPGRPRREG